MLIVRLDIYYKTSGNMWLLNFFFWFYVFMYANNIALFVHSNPWLLYPMHVSQKSDFEYVKNENANGFVHESSYIYLYENLNNIASIRYDRRIGWLNRE
jgi:hypothetical protein